MKKMKKLILLILLTTLVIIMATSCYSETIPPEPTYRVVYHSSGATSSYGLPSSYEYYEEDEYALIEWPSSSFKKTGYTYDGWDIYTGDETLIDCTEHLVKVGKSDIHVYARWIEN
jgi:hypothetical protein